MASGCSIDSTMSYCMELGRDHDMNSRDIRRLWLRGLLKSWVNGNF